MMVRIGSSVVATWMLLLWSAADASQFGLAVPSSVNVQLTDEGPIFVGANGMSLYSFNREPEERHPLLDCENEVRAEIYRTGSDNFTNESENLGADFAILAPDSQTRRTCIQKHPPLLAPSDAHPVGKWTIVQRADGTRQWAYEGAPLYMSIKDKLPGDVNGNMRAEKYLDFNPWKVASAPLPGAPLDVTVQKTALGLALADAFGKVLYFSDSNETISDPKLWRPFVAPALATSDGLTDWSIVTRPSVRQWAYKGKLLYTYARDSDVAKEFQKFRNVFGDLYGKPLKGWQAAVLKAAPQHPPEVTIGTIPNVLATYMSQGSLDRKVYADSQGMTLYTIHCVDKTSDRLDCDDVGDSPRYWTSFCGGEDRCAKIWHPLATTARQSEINNNIWSVISINPRHPFRAIEKDSQGVNVWAYRGRPVFTYEGDRRPGDCNAWEVNNNQTQGSQMKASPVMAYEAPQEARKHPENP
ncbi:hypothetical protein [Bradyrhizobium sp. WSM3983]|uniref:hypothetical protein n=1 Tax=Bradyrhizobium sp. WSM3983 TaxID=1038867 RepID=UPI000405DFAD|nr:hypothetical protein [Bradyrhizobium sp. WSM3983]